MISLICSIQSLQASSEEKKKQKSVHELQRHSFENCFRYCIKGQPKDACAKNCKSPTEQPDAQSANGVINLRDLEKYPGIYQLFAQGVVASEK